MKSTAIILSIALAVIGNALPAIAADSDATVKDIGNSQYELTLHTSTTINIFEAQSELVSTAKRTCGAKEFHFGHYAFDIQTPLEGATVDKPNLMTLTQTIRCGSATPPTIPQATSASDGWKPSLIDQSQIESQTYRYFSATDTGDYTTAYEMFADGMKEATHFDSWAASMKSLKEKSGRVLERRVLKITWYKDPPSAPEPGIYAAADYSGQFENIPIYCGYVAWHRGADGNYRVIREEQNYIDKATVAKMNPSQVQALAAKFGCSAG